MNSERAGKIPKSVRRELRERAARRRRLGKRVRRIAVGLGLVLVPLLGALECSGPEEIVGAEVIRTERWEHYTQTGGFHGHLRAVVRIDRRNKETIERADAFRRGQRVPVWIRRGRISGWPYFQQLATAEEATREAESGESAN